MTMRFHRSLLFPTLGGLLALSSPAANGQVQPATTGGLFTQAQADRGKAVYAQFCAACHGESLGGGQAPALTGTQFQASWSHPQMNVDDLFYYVRVTMPPNAAKAVPLEDQTAVAAFLLQSNGFAAGSAPLAVGLKGLQGRFPWAGKFRSFNGRSAEPSAPAAHEEFIAGDAKERPEACCSRVNSGATFWRWTPAMATNSIASTRADRWAAAW